MSNRKVFLKRSTEDLCYVCEDYEYVELNEINAALTARFWSQWSPTPLKTMLIKRFGSIRNMYLRLDVACEHSSMIVKSIILKCALRDADDRSWIIGCIDELDWEAIQGCVEEYFQSMGYDKIECTEDEDIVNFVLRLEQEIPLVKGYFKVLYKCNEEIARIGFFGENDEYEVYVKSDDEMSIPHFHVRNSETQDGHFETCVCIETNSYCLHDAYKDLLSSEQQGLLADYMTEFSPYNLYRWPIKRNYERIAEAWNINNDGNQVILKYDDGEDVIIPDYAHIK